MPGAMAPLLELTVGEQDSGGGICQVDGGPRSSPGAQSRPELPEWTAEDSTASGFLS